MRNTCLFFQPGNLQNTQCINVDGWSALDGMYKMVCSKWAKRPNLVARFQPEMQQMTSPILTPHSDLLSKFQQRLIPITIAFCKGSWLTPQKYGVNNKAEHERKMGISGQLFPGGVSLRGYSETNGPWHTGEDKRQDSQNSTKKDG